MYVNIAKSFYIAVNGSEDIDVLPNGLAIFSSVSSRIRISPVNQKGAKLATVTPLLIYSNYPKA